MEPSGEHLRGCTDEPELSSVLAVLLLMIAVTLISLAPVIRTWLVPGEGVVGGLVGPRWTYALLLLGLLQVAAIVYLTVFPAGAVCRACALLSLTQGILYAGLLAYFSLISSDSLPVLWLELGTAQLRKIPARWCQLMLCLFLIQAFVQSRLFPWTTTPT